MKTVAGIDLGTQSMKVVIYDYENHEIIEKASCPMDLISENDGTREQKTEWFDNGLTVCFGKLSAENKKQFFIPKNFAHGFLVLSDYAEFAYKCTDFYHPEDEGGLMWNDSTIGIDWTTVAPDVKPLLSEKDTKHQAFSFENNYFDLNGVWIK